ncbi:MAG: hypothetical protein ACE5FN_01865 [Leptospirillia bacterium]
MASVLAALGLLLASSGPLLAASPDDPVRDRFAVDFAVALDGYQKLGDQAVGLARQGLIAVDPSWDAALKEVDAHLVRHEAVFFPMISRPWTRESAVFSNLQGARMWLWSVRDALNDGAAGIESIDVVDGRVRAELISSFLAYIDKARTLFEGGEFKGSYFADTLVPVLADYCAYPEDGKRVKPDFEDERIFDDVRASAADPDGAI